MTHRPILTNKPSRRSGTLDLGMVAVEEQFRRTVFNVIARNQDDHVKNISFLMDRSGKWSLSPAYDVAYAYNPSGTWDPRPPDEFGWAPERL